jgi:hypothetical protein
VVSLPVDFGLGELLMASLGSLLIAHHHHPLQAAAKWTDTELTIRARFALLLASRLFFTPLKPLIRIAFQLHCLM